MNLYNPTEEVISQDYCLRNYTINPGESKVVPDDVGEHILRKRTCDGIVALDYSEEEEKKYGSLSNYKKAKGKEGLQNLLSWLDLCMRQESFGIKESIEKNAAPEIAMSFKVDYFKEKIAKVKAMIDSYSDPKMEPKTIESEVITETKPLQFRKRGKPFQKKVIVETPITEMSV